MKQSPARAEPHDATSWLPLPDLDSLPALDDMVRAWSDPAGKTHPAESKPSPARAEPHDPGAWLPLPDLDDLPSVEDLLTRESWSARPSPARAEPHDPGAWLPLPDLDPLLEIQALLAPETRTPLAPTGLPGRPEPGFAPASTAAQPEVGTAAAPTKPPAGGDQNVEPPAGGDQNVVPPDGGDGPVAPPAPRRRRFGTRTIALLALAAITIGAVVYALPKIIDQGANVDVRVDGRVVAAQTGVATVGAFLHEQHVAVGPHDRVVPAPGAAITDGMHVIVARGFPITVDLDGNPRTVWTTYHSPVDFIAKDLKLGSQVVVRANPNRLAKGSLIVLRTRHVGTLVVDGQTVSYDAPAVDLDELLHQYSVQLRNSDYVTENGLSSSLDQPLRDGANVTVMRVGEAAESRPEAYNVDAVTAPDPTKPVGYSRTDPGTPGTEQVTEDVTRVNGVVTSSITISKVPTVKAIPTIHYYGTKADPMWDRIAACETGGNWGFVGPSFSGGLGFFNGTWDAFGGRKYAPNAGLATREEQIVVAMEIQRKVGLSGWGCAHKLGYVR